MTRLKAMLNVLSDSYPMDAATSARESAELVSLSAACSIRQRVRYSKGDVPTTSLNFIAKAERDMPTCPANSWSVHR